MSTINLKNIGDTIEGEYLGSSTVHTDFGLRPVFKFLKASGAYVNVYKAVELEEKLSNIPFHTKVRIQVIGREGSSPSARKLFDVKALNQVAGIPIQAPKALEPIVATPKVNPLTYTGKVRFSTGYYTQGFKDFVYTQMNKGVKAPDLVIANPSVSSMQIHNIKHNYDRPSRAKPKAAPTVISSIYTDAAANLAISYNEQQAGKPSVTPRKSLWARLTNSVATFFGNG